MPHLNGCFCPRCPNGLAVRHYGYSWQQRFLSVIVRHYGGIVQW